MKKLVFFLLLVVLVKIKVYAQFGPLVPDSSFNNTAFIVSDSFETKSLLVMDDGRILCAGSINQFFSNSIIRDYSICCLLPNGIIDNTFGDNGFITMNNGTNDEIFWKIEKFNSGYLAFGVFNIELGSGWPFKRYSGDCFMIKFDDSGNLDLTFGNNGSQSISTNPNFTIVDVEVSQNNEIYLLTDQQESCGYEYKGKILKLDAQGNFDLTFGQQGFAEFPLYLPQCMNLLPEGGFVILGTDTSQQLAYPFNYLGSSCWQAAHICKLNANGTVDSNYGNNGKNLLSTNGLGIIFRSSLAFGNGFYIMGDEGYFDSNQNLYKLNNLGEFDSTFSDDGKIRVTVQDEIGSWNIYNYSMVQENNDLWMCGAVEIRNMNCRRKDIIRVSSDGIQDSTLGFFPFSAEPIFNQEIEDSTYFGVNWNCLEQSNWNDIKFQQDGKILAAGYVQNWDTSSNSLIPNGYIVSRLIPSVESNPVNTAKTNEKSFEVYPNPTNSNINIYLPTQEKVSIGIYNSLGQLVKQINISDIKAIHLIDFETFPSGLYFVNVMGNNWISSKKVIKIEK